MAGLALGALPLNLIHPASTTLDLSSVFKTLLPRTVSSPLTLPLLNSSPFSPTSSPSLGSLSTGLLQLAPCSLLHFDARSMGEGKLVETGLANVRAIEKLAEEGKLGYVFPYDVFEMEADVGLVVSTEGGKTFLNGFWPVHVAPSPIQQPARASWKDIDAWRGLLATARRARPTVPASLTSKVQAMFVEARRGAKTADEAESRMGKDDLARIVEVAGGLAKLEGKAEVGEADVERAGVLEAERRRRLAV